MPYQDSIHVNPSYSVRSLNREHSIIFYIIPSHKKRLSDPVAYAIETNSRYSHLNPYFSELKRHLLFGNSLCIHTH